MVEAREFVDELRKNNLGPIYEVPCSIFKDLLNYLFENEEIEVVNPANEAIAMAQAAGSFLATNKIPIVMMQNSGLNNTLNALTSLNRQYHIPAVYIISWRGKGKDAEEHNFMGERLERILETFDIPYRILSEKYSEETEWAAYLVRETMKPVALIMKKGFIDKYPEKREESDFPMDRWKAIETIVDNAEGIYISTNGFPSRQLFNILKIKDKEDGRAFYMIGSMGHALGIGIEEARKIKNRKIVVLDGDGSCLMHLGTMGGVAKYIPDNLIHVILDNRSYGSTGSQPTQSENVDFAEIGKAFGYKVFSAENSEELVEAIKIALQNGPALIHVKINQKEIPEDDERMGRVSYSAKEIKERHQKYLERL